MKRSEIDIAAPVVAWLIEQGWDVYQEVSMGYADRRIDIVATHGGLVWAIECKTSLSIAVMEQAYYWKHSAHFSSIAVPRSKRSRGSAFAERILERDGIGKISVGYGHVYQSVAPALNRRAYADRIRDRLCEEQKCGLAAGSSGGGYETPFRQTSRALARIVEERPGISLRDAIDAIRHHYASDVTARSVLRQRIESGLVPGVRILREGRKAFLQLDAGKKE